MGIDTSISCSASQVFILTVWDVKVSLWVTVFLGQSEVDDIDLVSTLSDTHQEVVGLDITVNEGFGMDVLDPGDKLVSQEEDCLQREFAVAEVKQILQARSKQIQHHGIVVTLGTKPTDEGDSDASSEGFVDACLIFELRMFGLDTFEFDGNLLARNDVGAYS